MKIIIAGAGRIGGTLAEVLSEEGHDITVIDCDSETIAHVSGDMDVICLEGSATDPDVLREAGAEEADLLIAATERDEVNMVCGIAAKKLGTGYVIARVRDPQYLGKTAFLQDAFGITFLVNPEYECAREISRVLHFPGAARVDTFSRGSIEIAEYRVPENSPLKGIVLKDLGRVFGAKVLVGLAERDGEAIIPNGSFVIRERDRLSLTGTSGELRKFFGRIGAYKKPVRSVMIVGGGRISVYLARLLNESGIQVSVIEENRKRCDTLCELLPEARIICGDASRSDVLLEENIREKDAFAALTGDDGNNIVTAIYARKQGVWKTVVQVNHEHFAEMLEYSDQDCLITPKEVVVQIITRFVRAIGNSADCSAMESLYKLADGKAEAIEFIVEPGLSFTGIRLRDLKLKPDILIAAIIRENRSIMPDGTAEILPGDHVVVVSKADRIRDLNDIAL